MNKTITAKYFDGKTSASQVITLVFNSMSNKFRLQFENGTSVVWELEDIRFEQYGSVLEIRHKNHSGALIKIDDKDFSKGFYNAMQQNNRVDIHTRLLHLGLSKIIFIAIGLLTGFDCLGLFLCIASCRRKSSRTFT